MKEVQILEIEKELTSYMSRNSHLGTEKIIELYEDRLLEILRPLLNDEYYDLEANKYGSKETREAFQNIVELLKTHSNILLWSYKKKQH